MSRLNIMQFSKNNFFRPRRPATFHSFSPVFVSKLSTNASLVELKRNETFHEVLPGILDLLVTNPKLKEVPDVASWIKEVLEYNLHGGKLARGLSTVMAYEILEKPENITDESVNLSRVLGWCVEMLQTYLLVLDDIMDGSQKRRGVPCWYKLHNVGLGAVNDSILIYTSMMHVLKFYFRCMPQYSDIIDLFNDTLQRTSAGQHLDLTVARQNKNDYSQFKIEHYNAIVKYKAAYYTYNLPVCLGMLLANIVDKKIHRETEEICFKIGHLFQMQDDFIDVFGVQSHTGKNGTDIQEGKCTWLSVTALERCSDVQKKVFLSCFGSSEPAHIERIKSLYEELDLPNIYLREERMRYDEVVRLANSLSNPPRASELILKLIDDIYKRNK